MSPTESHRRNPNRHNGEGGMPALLTHAPSVADFKKAFLIPGVLQTANNDRLDFAILHTPLLSVLDKDVSQDMITAQMQLGLDTLQNYAHAIALMDEDPGNRGMVTKLMKNYRSTMNKLLSEKNITVYDMMAIAKTHNLGPLSQQAAAIQEMFTALGLTHLPEQHVNVIPESLYEKYQYLNPKLGEAYLEPHTNPILMFHSFSNELTKMVNLAAATPKSQGVARAVVDMSHFNNDFEYLAFQNRSFQIALWIENEMAKQGKQYKTKSMKAPGGQMIIYIAPSPKNPEEEKVVLQTVFREEVAKMKDWNKREVNPIELTILCNLGLPSREIEEQKKPLSVLRNDAQSGPTGFIRRGHTFRLTDETNPILHKNGFRSVTIRQMNPHQFAKYYGVEKNGEYDEEVKKWIEVEQKKDHYGKLHRKQEEIEATAISRALLERGIATTKTAQGSYIFSEITVGTNTYTTFFNESYKPTFSEEKLGEPAKYWLERISLGYMADIRNDRIQELQNKEEKNVQKEAVQPLSGEIDTGFRGRAAALHVLPAGQHPTINEKTDTIVSGHFIPISHQDLNLTFIQVQHNEIKLEDVPFIINENTHEPYGEPLKLLIEKLLKRIDKKKTPGICEISVYDEIEDKNAPPVVATSNKAKDSIFPEV